VSDAAQVRRGRLRERPAQEVAAEALLCLLVEEAGRGARNVPRGEGVEREHLDAGIARPRRERDAPGEVARGVAAEREHEDAAGSRPARGEPMRGGAREHERLAASGARDDADDAARSEDDGALLRGETFEKRIHGGGSAGPTRTVVGEVTEAAGTPHGLTNCRRVFSASSSPRFFFRSST